MNILNSLISVIGISLIGANGLRCLRIIQSLPVNAIGTSWSIEGSGLAEEWGGPTCQALQRMAVAYNLAIVGSLMARDNGKL